MQKLSQEDLDNIIFEEEFKWKQWKISNLPDSLLGWARIMPGAAANRALKERKKHLKSFIQECVSLRQDTPDMGDWYNLEIEKCNNEIAQIDFLLDKSSGDVNKKFADKKLAAQQVPIQTFFPTELKGSNQLKGRCPFHEDKTPSFSISVPKNQWYCFSESTGGDAISFAMRLWDVDFKTAVNRLTNK